MNLENASPDKIFLVPSDGEEGRNLLDKTWKTFSVETFDGLNESYVVNFDLTKKLSQISIKILNIYAEHDLRIPVRVPKSFRSFNPAIVDYQISDSGHFPFIQAKGREQIYRILRSSL
jgi:pimeloyl-ACP methyl ester carboxylesterase